MIKRVILLLCLLVGAAQVMAQQEAEGGDYFVSGTQLDGDSYSGGLEILQYSDADYLTLTWQLSEPLTGRGLLNGDVLSASFGVGCTLASYVIEDDDTLSGSWLSDDGALNFEIASPSESNDSTFTYTLDGELADDTRYTGTMTITVTDEGEAAEVVQEINGGVVAGTGIVQNDVLTVVYGESGCGLQSYVVEEDGTLDGIWTLVGETTVGTETATPLEITGRLSVNGTNPDGSEYTGEVEVSADNQVHSFNYTIGEDSFPGVGILRGNVLAVGYGGDTCSVASYFVESDGTLDGQWTLVGSSETGSEFAVRTDDVTVAEGAIPDISGEYAIVGANPGDVADEGYEGQLEITQNGDVYNLTWTLANGQSESGVGVLIGNTLMVGFGGDTCAVNAYEVTEDSLEGLWTTVGDESTGTETLSR